MGIVSMKIKSSKQKKISSQKPNEGKQLRPLTSLTKYWTNLFTPTLLFTRWLRDTAEKVGVVKEKKATHKLIWGYAIYSLFTLKKVTISYSACW